MTLYDLGGGHRVRDIWKHYLSESFGFIFVIDASNRNRITECRNVFASFVENDKVAGKPILMLEFRTLFSKTIFYFIIIF